MVWLPRLHLIRGRFVEGWRDTGAVIRWLCLILPMLGTGCVAIGVLGDANAWWDKQPFLTNLVSSMASALFGIPLALVVFQRLTAAQADRLEKRAADRTLQRAATDMLTAALTLSRSDPQATPTAWLRAQMEQVIDELGQAARIYNTLRDQAVLTSGYSWDGMVSSRSLIAEARPHLTAGAMALANVIEVWDQLLLTGEHELDAAWKGVQASRDFLNSYVMPRVVEADDRSPAISTILTISELLDNAPTRPNWSEARRHHQTIRSMLDAYGWKLQYLSAEDLLTTTEKIADELGVGITWLDWYCHLINQIRTLHDPVAIPRTSSRIAADDQADHG